LEIEEFGNVRISIWGAGGLGKKVASFLSVRVNIDCFYDIDENKHGEIVCGIPIKKWCNNKEELVVIATEHWAEVCSFLKEQGKILFKDYLPWFFLESTRAVSYDKLYSVIESIGEITEEEWKYYKKRKKLIVFHGSCHSEFLGALLSLHPKIKKEYRIICAPRSHLNNSNRADSLYVFKSACSYEKNVDLFKQIDVFIYQKKPDFYDEMDVKYIENNLSASCEKIKISFLNFTGYFIQCRNDKEYQNRRSLYSLHYKDYYIDKLIKRGMTSQQILECIKEEDFIKEERIWDLVHMSVENLKYLDAESDVKIGDFIADNFQKEQLFYDPGHPTNKVLIEYANRIIRYIVGESVEPLESYNSYEMMLSALPGVAMYSRSTIIYPCVLRALGLKKYEKSFRVNTISYFTEMLSFDEYVLEYIKMKRERE